MGYGDYYWGLYRDYYRDPFPHSPLSTRQLRVGVLDSRLQALMLLGLGATGV